MKIQPSPKYLILNIPYDLLFASLFSLIPLIIGSFILLVISAISTTISWPTDSRFYMGIVLSVYLVILFFILLSEFLYYKYSSAVITKDTVEITNGGFSTNRISYPLSKVSSSEVVQSIVEKLLGIATIYISGEDDEDFEIKGVQIDKATTFSHEVASQQKVKISSAK